jgi:hypothetical protein
MRLRKLAKDTSGRALTIDGSFPGHSPVSLSFYCSLTAGWLLGDRPTCGPCIELRRTEEIALAVEQRFLQAQGLRDITQGKLAKTKQSRRQPSL